MKLAQIALFLAATACGSAHKEKADVTPNESQQDPAYYVAEYETLARPHLGQDFKVTTNIQLVATLPEASAGAVGFCLSDVNKIELLESYWTTLNGTGRKEIMYHELAHCNQYRPHLNALQADGTPVSIMNGVALPSWQSFQTNEVYYETELFAVVETCGVGEALPCRTAN